MEELKLSNYVVTPRSIRDDYHNGIISLPERNLMLWLRVCGSPYGIALVDMGVLARETFNNPVDKSYINKLLISLKSKKYIWYSDRKGRRGSFEVHMGDWILPSKSIKTLDSYFDSNTVRGNETRYAPTEVEVDTELASLSQRFKVENNPVKSNSSMQSIREMLRGYDNDTYKEKENDNESSKSPSFKKKDLRVSVFKPDSYEEQQCLDMARAIGDEEVGFTLGIYRRYGLTPLIRAKDEFDKAHGIKKENPPAFFNALVQQQLGSQLI